MGISIEEVVDGVFKLQGGGDRCIEHNGERLYRFMDSFYIRKEHLYELTPDEVSNLCRARSRYPQLITDVNDLVQSIFRRLVSQVNPSSLLEIGSGSRPLLSPPPESILYVMSDADQSVMMGTASKAQFCEFSSTNSMLPYEESFFDMVVAVFVLQFNFYEAQISELYRCIAPQGIFVANVYRRPSHASKQLCAQFESKGFNVRRIEDPQSLCSGHEYWLISKCADKIAKTAEQLHACLS
ncbi:hypothetical protein Q058_02847 [Pseudomonas aeruginosa BL04]|nr:hypothetical protein Q058_02847 [Pseudomonas aeruginosa BL04]